MFGRRKDQARPTSGSLTPAPDAASDASAPQDHGSRESAADVAATAAPTAPVQSSAEPDTAKPDNKGSETEDSGTADSDTEQAQPATAGQPALRRISGQLEGLPGRIGIPRGLMILLSLAAASIIILLTRELGDIVAPVFFGINLVLAASPLGNWLNRLGSPRWLSAVVSGLVVMAFLATFFYAIYYSVAALIREIPRYAPQFEALYDNLLALLESVGITSTYLQAQLEQSVNAQTITSAATGVLSNVGSTGALLAVLLTVIFFLTFDSVNFGRRLGIADKAYPQITEALISFAQGVRRYWVVTTVFGLIVAVLDVILLMALGVPLAFVWGVFSFLTNYIPNIGFVLGLIPPALMALLDQGPITALIVVIGYSVLNFVIQSLIQPKFTGDAVGVTPTIAFLSLLFWAWVLGPLGALLALPATLLIKAVLIDADPKMRWLNAFIASDPTTANATSVSGAFHGPDSDNYQPQEGLARGAPAPREDE